MSQTDAKPSAPGCSGCLLCLIFMTILGTIGAWLMALLGSTLDRVVLDVPPSIHGGGIGPFVLAGFPIGAIVGGYIGYRLANGGR
jgi:hypothetical protein